MQNIYVYNRKDKIGKLIWYRGIVFYPYVVTHKGELASKETLNTICRLLQIQPGDLLEYVEEI